MYVFSTVYFLKTFYLFNKTLAYKFTVTCNVVLLVTKCLYTGLALHMPLHWLAIHRARKI